MNHAIDDTPAYSDGPAPERENGDPSVYFLLTEACADLAKYAVSSGLSLPPDTIPTLERLPDPASGRPAPNLPLPSLAELNAVHEQLVRCVEPACPRGIQFVAQERRKKSMFKFLGPIPLARRLMGVSIIALILFILLSLTPHIDATAENWSSEKTFGHEQLIRILFLLSAALLGAAFAALYRINHFIAQNRYDPTHDAAYWVNITVGAIAGLILSTMIPIEQSVQSDLAKPLLAMLGGFSAEAVYKILSRMVESLSSMVGADHGALSEMAERQHKSHIAIEKTKVKHHLAARLLKLRDHLDANPSHNDIKKNLADIIDRLTDNTDV